MDDHRFDALTRSLRSRRTAFGGLLGGSLVVLLGLTVPEEATAHNRVPSCKPIKDPKRRLRCLRRARAHNRWHQRCAASTAAICAAHCGSLTNSCGQPVNCPCPTGKECLSNRGCAQTCTAETCPAGCGCFVSADGPSRCTPTGMTCNQFPTPCSSTQQCPAGHSCQLFLCGSGFPTGRCAPLC